MKFVLISVVLFFLSIYASVVIYDRTHEQVCEMRRIDVIGGCDRTGRCGVIYEDGMKGFEDFPVIGELVDRCRWVDK